MSSPEHGSPGAIPESVFLTTIGSLLLRKWVHTHIGVVFATRKTDLQTASIPFADMTLQPFLEVA
jgi:hypothetical protein